MFLVVVSGFSTCPKTQDETKPNVPQQGTPAVTETSFSLWRSFSSSSMRFDLEDLGSVDICRPLLNGGALR